MLPRIAVYPQGKTPKFSRQKDAEDIYYVLTELTPKLPRNSRSDKATQVALIFGQEDIFVVLAISLELSTYQQLSSEDPVLQKIKLLEEQGQ